jgi:hypothetical protein
MHDFRQEKRGLASNGGRMTVYGMRSSHSLSLLIFCLLLDIRLSVSSRSYSPSNLPKRWFKLWPIKPAYLLEFPYLPRSSGDIFTVDFFVVSHYTRYKRSLSNASSSQAVCDTPAKDYTGL